MSLEGQVAIVTGAGRGIGRATALRLASEGATVVVCELDAEVIEPVVEDITQAGGTATGAQVNVGDVDAVNAMIQQVHEQYGRIDILVNNAGITRDSFAHKIDDKSWDLVLKVDLSAVFYAIRAVIPIMKAQKYGRIVNLSSFSAYGNIGQANYSAAKAGVIGLTATVAKELGPFGITVNAIAPGFIETRMTEAIPEKLRERIIPLIPMQRPGKPEEVAGVVAFLSSKDVSFTTGQVINVNGGIL